MLHFSYYYLWFLLLIEIAISQGGFGSLLRGAGKGGKTTINFDSCRDLDGRRLRHVNAEKKIKEWRVCKNARTHCG